MPILVKGVILAGFLLLFPAGSEAGEKKLIFITPNAFLGAPPISQLDYITGFLDALYFVEKNGALDPVVTNCLFEDEDTTKTRRILLLESRHAVREAKKRGDMEFSVAVTLVARLKIICPKR